MIVAAIGASGSGKSLWVKQTFLSPAPERLIIFDYKREHVQETVIQGSIQNLIAAVRKPRFRVVFQPSFDAKQLAYQFNVFCAAALEAGNATVLVEELGVVTRPNFAPEQWKRLCVTGRQYRTTQGVLSHMRVIATAQRPAMIDKDFFGNCTLVHAGRLQMGPDVKVMQDVLDTDQDLSKLKDLEFIERDVLKGENRTGKLVFNSVKVPQKSPENNPATGQP